MNSFKIKICILLSFSFLFILFQNMSAYDNTQSSTSNFLNSIESLSVDTFSTDGLKNTPAEEIKNLKLDFDANGDGISDDTLAFKKAITSGAKIILVPSGTYLIDENIALKSNQSWIGLNLPTIKVKSYALMPRTIFSIQHANNIYIEGINFDGNGSEQDHAKTNGLKALIDIQGNAKNIIIKNCFLKNALQWGLQIKGSIDINGNGVPENILLHNINTQGSLGIGLDGVNGGRGSTGIAWIAGRNVEINGGTSFDFFDIEPNNFNLQPTTGIVTSRVFRDGADVGFVEIKNNTFLRPLSRNIACRVTGQSTKIINNIFSSSIDTRSEGWIGVGIESNNTHDTEISDNKFFGNNLLGIAPLALVRIKITKNRFKLSYQDPFLTVKYLSIKNIDGTKFDESQTFKVGAITMSNGAIRDLIMSSNTITYHSESPIAMIQLDTPDQRILEISNNILINKFDNSKGVIINYGSKNFKQVINANFADVLPAFSK